MQDHMDDKHIKDVSSLNGLNLLTFKA